MAYVARSAPIIGAAAGSGVRGVLSGHRSLSGSFSPTLKSEAKRIVDSYIDAKQDFGYRMIKGYFGTTDPVSEGIKGGLFGSLLNIGSSSNPSSPSSGSARSFGSSSNPSSPSSGSARSRPDYLYADLARAYGMDASTAYQEALSNTSYQRAVKDLQAAGLNPVLAASSLSPAGGVYYPHELGSVGSEVSPGYVSSGRSSAKATSHFWYKTLSNIGSIAGPVVGASIAKSPYGALTGSTVGRSVLGALGNLLDSMNV